MAKIQGNQSAGSDFERHIFDEGIYDMKLVKMLGFLRKGTAEYPEEKPALMMVWAWCDENGNLYKSEDDQNYELVDTLGMPKNFGYSDRSGYWKRLSEISGFAINKDTVGLTGHDFGDFILSFDDILEVIQNPDADKPDKKGKVYATSIEVNGVEQLGRVCKVVIKKVPGKNDPSKFFNNVGSVMQAQASQPKRPPTAKVAPAQPKAAGAPVQQARPAPAPAPQEHPVSPSEAVDLPF